LPRARTSGGCQAGVPRADTSTVPGVVARMDRPESRSHHLRMRCSRQEAAAGGLDYS
jgi:hypothetical protein